MSPSTHVVLTKRERQIMDALYRLGKATAGEILEALPVALLIVDSRQRIRQVNLEAERLLGYRREELLGGPLDRLLPDHVRAAHGGWVDGYLASPDTRAMGAHRDLLARRADGRLFPVEIALKPIRSGEDLFAIAAIVDLTERKAIDRVRRETADKRGGGEVRGDSAFCGPDGSSPNQGADQVAGSEPTPEFAAMFAEECEYLLARLGDPELVRVALLKLEGFTNDEVGAKLGRAGRSIQRKLETIRAIWEQAAGRET
jgi:PAS domain S-box-containing protein